MDNERIESEGVDFIFEERAYARLVRLGDAIFIKVRGEYVDRSALLEIIAGLEIAADAMRTAPPEECVALCKSYLAERIISKSNIVRDQRLLRKNALCVYFLRGSMGIKIGRTSNFSDRKHQLQNFAKEHLETLVCIETDQYKELESALHIKFSHLRTEGEWFHPMDEILQWLSGLGGA